MHAYTYAIVYTDIVEYFSYMYLYSALILVNEKQTTKFMRTSQTFNKKKCNTVRWLSGKFYTVSGLVIVSLQRYIATAVLVFTGVSNAVS